MSKFTREEKLEMISEYHQRHMSINAICNKHGISATYLKQLLKTYETQGTDEIGLGKLGKPLSRYPGQFKLDIVKERISSGMGYREIARKYNINHVVIMKWEKTYLENGERALLEEQRGRSCKEGSPKKGRPSKLNKQVEKDLIAEVQQLRMENEYLKKLNALTQEGVKSLPGLKRK